MLAESRGEMHPGLQQNRRVDSRRKSVCGLSGIKHWISVRDVTQIFGQKRVGDLFAILIQKISRI